jgi:hypothetical protein
MHNLDLTLINFFVGKLHLKLIHKIDSKLFYLKVRLISH